MTNCLIGDPMGKNTYMKRLYVKRLYTEQDYEDLIYNIFHKIITVDIYVKQGIYILSKKDIEVTFRELLESGTIFDMEIHYINEQLTEDNVVPSMVEYINFVNMVRSSIFQCDVSTTIDNISCSNTIQNDNGKDKDKNNDKDKSRDNGKDKDKIIIYDNTAQKCDNTAQKCDNIAANSVTKSCFIKYRHGNANDVTVELVKYICQTEFALSMMNRIFIRLDKLYEKYKTQPHIKILNDETDHELLFNTKDTFDTIIRDQISEIKSNTVNAIIPLQDLFALESYITGGLLALAFIDMALNSIYIDGVKLSNRIIEQAECPYWFEEVFETIITIKVSFAAIDMTNDHVLLLKYLTINSLTSMHKQLPVPNYLKDYQSDKMVQISHTIAAVSLIFEHDDFFAQIISDALVYIFEA